MEFVFEKNRRFVIDGVVCIIALKAEYKRASADVWKYVTIGALSNYFFVLR